MTKTIIPAQPGFFLLSEFAIKSAGLPRYEQHPIVGWAIDEKGRASPVTMFGVHDLKQIIKEPDLDFLSVQAPDGLIHLLGGDFDGRTETRESWTSLVAHFWLEKQRDYREVEAFDWSMEYPGPRLRNSVSGRVDLVSSPSDEEAEPA